MRNIYQYALIEFTKLCKKITLFINKLYLLLFSIFNIFVALKLLKNE
jgi:hypothetical protein